MENTGKEQAEQSRIRVRIEFRVEGDARFLSHHDMMRCMELAAARAELPIRFSQGFNPRPKMSLPQPKPVGVASLAEILVIELTEATAPDEIVRRLAEQTPVGVTVVGADVLEGKRKPLQALSARYRLDVAASDAAALAQRIDSLRGQAAWPLLRTGRKGKPDHQLDLRTLIPELDFDGAALQFTCRPEGSLWARIPEVLDLLEIDTPAYRAQVVRTTVAWATEPG